MPKLRCEGLDPGITAGQGLANAAREENLIIHTQILGADCFAPEG